MLLNQGSRFLTRCPLQSLTAQGGCLQPGADLDGAAICFDKALLWALRQLA